MTTTDTAQIRIERRPGAEFDALIYSEGEGRSLELGCRARETPMLVWIPRGKPWTERMPPWARDLEQTVAERVRASGATVYEWTMDGWNTVTTIQSPDRSFHIETEMKPDDRGPEWERTRIIATAGNEVLANLHLHATEGAIVFPRPGAVVLNLRGRYGDKQRLRVDIARRTFHLDGDPDGSEQPLHLLEARLNPPRPTVPPAGAAAAPSPRQARFDGFIGVVGAFFALGGLWLTLAGKGVGDRLTGIAGMLMGAYGVSNALAELRRGRAARSQSANATSPSSRRRVAHLLPYAPLIAVGVELVWLVFLFAGFLFAVGDARYTHTPGSPAVRFWDLVALLPALAGLALGVVCVGHGCARRVVEWTCLALGCIGCGTFVLVFGHELLGLP